MDIIALAKEVHENALAHGFCNYSSRYHIAWMYAELGEAFNAWREGGVPYRIENGKPEGLVAELADVVILTLDILARFKLPEELAAAEDDVSEQWRIESKQDAYDGLSSVEELCVIIGHCIDQINIQAHEGPNKRGVYTYCAKLIRDVCEWIERHSGFDAERVIREKMDYNKTRPYKHGRTK